MTHRVFPSCVLLLAFVLAAGRAATVTTAVDRVLLEGRPIKLWGVRTASASQSAESTRHLIAQLDEYRRHGLNAVAVFYQGSSGGYSNPFAADGSAIDPAHHVRLVEIVEACDRRGWSRCANSCMPRIRRGWSARAVTTMRRTSCWAARAMSMCCSSTPTGPRTVARCSIASWPLA